MADFLVCDVECIPGRVELTRAFPVGDARGAEREIASIFRATARRTPVSPDEAGVRVEWAMARSALRPGDAVRAAIGIVRCETRGADPGRCPAVGEPRGGAHPFFPDRVESVGIEVLGVHAHPSAASGAVVELELHASRDDPGADQELSGIVQLDGGRAPLLLEIRVPLARARRSSRVTDVRSPLLGAPPGPRASPDPSQPPATGGTTLAWALVLALLGGLILNAMPCVLPVLALKVFGLATIAGEGRRARVLHAGAFTSGILAAMWALAAIVVALRATGTAVGWGFQFQEPLFSAALAGLMVVLALVLFGVVELRVGATQLASRVDRAHGVRRSFGEGALTVVLATPCSAPFLGTAIGFAFASSTPVIFAVLGAVGLGLALPYALLVLVPGASHLVPKPGPWMVGLSRVLGFALLGTAVWLVWLVGQVAGLDAATGTLASLVALGLATWVFGATRDASRRARLISRTLALAVLAGVAIAASSTDARRDDAGDADADAAQAWSDEGVAAALDAGKVVFVDFTADWCITCKANERLVLESDAVRRAFARADVAFFVADYTRRDERIRAALARQGKAGVPMYLVIHPSAPHEPRVLPELLTEDLVVDALRERTGDTG